MNEAKLIQEVRDFIAAHDAVVTAHASQMAAETAYDNAVAVNEAEVDELVAENATEEAQLAASVSIATDGVIAAVDKLAAQKSYLVGLLDGIEGTDPTPNDSPVVVS